jgi:hypothetical protein
MPLFTLVGSEGIQAVFHFVTSNTKKENNKSMEGNVLEVPDLGQA